MNGRVVPSVRSVPESWDAKRRYSRRRRPATRVCPGVKSWSGMSRAVGGGAGGGMEFPRRGADGGGCGGVPAARSRAENAVEIAPPTEAQGAIGFFETRAKDFLEISWGIAGPIKRAPERLPLVLVFGPPQSLALAARAHASAWRHATRAALYASFASRAAAVAHDGASRRRSSSWPCACGGARSTGRSRRRSVPEGACAGVTWARRGSALSTLLRGGASEVQGGARGGDGGAGGACARRGGAACDILS